MKNRDTTWWNLSVASGIAAVAIVVCSSLHLSALQGLVDGGGVSMSGLVRDHLLLLVDAFFGLSFTFKRSALRKPTLM